MNEITAYNHGREDAMADLGDRLARVTKQRHELLVAAREVEAWWVGSMAEVEPGFYPAIVMLRRAIAAVEEEK